MIRPKKTSKTITARLGAMVAGGALFCAASTAQAAFVPLDLSSIVNSDITTYTNGGNYPGPGPFNIGGIPFVFTDGGNGNTHVVGGLASLGVAQNYSIAGLNLLGVTAMYAIINTAFGICGNDIGSIGAQTAGASTFDTIRTGQNARDHFNDGSFCSTQTDAIATENFPGLLIYDVYRFDLSALTNGGVDAMTEFNFNTDGQGSLGEPFVAAVTFETLMQPTRASEPGMLALFGLGLIGIGLARRRRRART